MEKSSKSSSYWEDEYAQEQQHNSVREEQQQHSEEQQVHANAEEQQQYVGAEEQHQYVGAEGHMEEPEPWKFSNMYYQPRRTSKLTVSRGKSSVVEEEVNSGSDLSDSDYAIPPSESNSSASDDEVLEMRKYAKELKEKVRKNMLREDEGKTCNVSDDFIVPENSWLDDSDGEGTPYFESDDDMSYDEGSA
ncbi:uncharacterized protein LOC119354820 [Triticum dicoccoides]|uniref:uncharacterized protein LOC119274352 n=1 Tax=Triticum dicoccoides TaxID=85692 RepID=UPI00188FD854|nr:uncharacterized protein LOC119274352 [Triticum dicoccoides]XP_037449555.1 uncharacterized protein LOC119319173 [Triticum dicoccoides]XP_037477462.1 uncharacterized protein LOC119354820 [Triticum dicoccoides]XP_044343738.1 uncharacterized protein LOC123064297 [Triticum aestivum]